MWELIDETLGAAFVSDDHGYGDEVHFLDYDDGEFWRHGGVMEAKIREWLATKEEEEGAMIRKYCFDGIPAAHSSDASQTWASIEEEEEEEEEAQYEDGYEEGGGDLHAHSTSLGSAASLAPPLDLETHYYQFGDGPPPASMAVEEQKEEEEEELCPVCLEKLLQTQSLIRLPCRHNFHRNCLSPWQLQRSHASSCCPCCRAPIPAPPDSAAPPDLEARDATSDGAVDIMGLLADMEAALDRFGLRS